MTILERALYQDPPEEKGGTQPIEDLLEEAKRRGLTVQRLALVVGLSPALITKLCRRLIRFESIPRLVFNRIAEALEHTVQAVERCLQQPPMLARAASHRAEKAPTVMAPEDFFHAVREDRGLTATQRAYWLAQVQKTTEKPPQ
jgi:transcriptional regulator with XRE-family HTH domain